MLGYLIIALLIIVILSFIIQPNQKNNFGPGFDSRPQNPQCGGGLPPCPENSHCYMYPGSDRGQCVPVAPVCSARIPCPPNMHCYVTPGEKEGHCS